MLPDIFQEFREQVVVGKASYVNKKRRDLQEAGWVFIESVKWADDTLSVKMRKYDKN